MGTIQNGTIREHVDDRTLAHLHVVISGCFREGKSFAIELPAVGNRARVRIWMDHTVPLSLTYAGLETVALNAAWLDVMAKGSRAAGGLVVSGEPQR